MAHGTILHTAHVRLLLLLLCLLRRLLLLVGKLCRVELPLVGHEGGGIHDGTWGIRVVHGVEAVSIVVRDGVVHPGAHGVEADKLCAETSAINKYDAKYPLNGTGMNGDGAGRTARRVVMDCVESRRGLAEEMCGVGWENGQTQTARLA